MKRSSGYQKNGRYSGLFSYMEVKVRLMRYLLGIDNGGTFSKAAVFDEDGKQISVASVPTVTLTPKPGYTEKDLDELWEVNAQAVHKRDRWGCFPGCEWRRTYGYLADYLLCRRRLLSCKTDSQGGRRAFSDRKSVV